MGRGGARECSGHGQSVSVELLALPYGCVDRDGELLPHAAPPQVLPGQVEGVDIIGDAA